MPFEATKRRLHRLAAFLTNKPTIRNVFHQGVMRSSRNRRAIEGIYGDAYG